MKQIFLLSKENIDLAKEEVLALVEERKFKLNENLLLLDTDKRLDKRLAYTHKIYRFLFECSFKDLTDNMQGFDWQSVYKKDYCLRIEILNNDYGIESCKKNKRFSGWALPLAKDFQSPPTSAAVPKQADLIKCSKDQSLKKNISKNQLEKEFAAYIWNKIKNPIVNLTNPKTSIELFFTKNKVFCGLLLYKIKKDFMKRKAHLRPGFSPVSLHPRLARSLVNLSGIKEGETMLDPFCGTGGILIEANLMGINCVGSDIDDEMLEKAKKNVKDIKLYKQDATKITKKYKYIVTDLPYGLNTKDIDRKKLYSDFIKNLKKILTKKAVVVFPDSIKYKKCIKSLKIEKQFKYYIHKSMTKNILVLIP